MSDDRDPNIHEMDTYEAAVFEHDMDVFVELFDRKLKGENVSFREVEDEVDARRRADRLARQGSSTK